MRYNVCDLIFSEVLFDYCRKIQAKATGRKGIDTREEI